MIIIIYIRLTDEELRIRQVVSLVQGHIANIWSSWDSKLQSIYFNHSVLLQNFSFKVSDFAGDVCRESFNCPRASTDVLPSVVVFVPRTPML